MLALLLPDLPKWNHVHPLVVHFPIALLMIAPLFVLGGTIAGAAKGRQYLVTGFLLMLLGTGATFLAAATGDAAGEVANRTGLIAIVLERHEQMADKTEIIFSVLTILFAAILFLPRLMKIQSPTAFARAVPLVFLLVYLAGIGALVNTAHNGGRLVHELGIHNPPAPGSAAAAAKVEPRGDRE